MEPDDSELDDPREMTFVEHLEELRGVLFRSVLAVVAGGTLVGIFLRHFASLLNRPLHRAMGERDLLIDGLRTDGVIDAFTILLQMCVFGGVVLALPYILYEVARFVAPGLTRKEKALLRPGLLAGSALFLAGAALSFFVLVPSGIAASLYVNDLLGLTPVWSATQYYGMLIWMVFGVGLAFEFPLVLLLLLRLGIIRLELLANGRRYAVVFFLVLSAVITPSGDMLTFLLLAIPLYGLYELTLVVARRLNLRREEEEDEEDDLELDDE